MYILLFRTITSAVLYALSFLKATVLWPFSFIFLVPLMRCRFLSYKSAALLGFLWGVLAFSGIFFALLDLILLLGRGPLRYVYLIVFLAYCAFFSCVWFMATHFLYNRTRSLPFSWTVTSVCYFAWLYAAYFCGLTGGWHGCPLLHPLVPVNHFGLLGLLPVLGWCGLLVALVILQTGIAYKIKSVIVIALAVFGGGSLKNKTTVSTALQTVVVPLATFFYETRPYERAQEICNVLLQAEQEYPGGKLFVLPESAFPFPLEDHPYAINMWSRNGGLFEKYLIVPAHSRLKDSQVYCNSAFVLHKGRIIFRYDKKSLLPFFEQASHNFFLKECHQLFFTGKSLFVAAQGPSHYWSFFEKEVAHFCICSELLWNFIPPSCSTSTFILVHDGYYRYEYFPELLALFARFRAVQTEQSVVYVSWITSFQV